MFQGRIIVENKENSSGKKSSPRIFLKRRTIVNISLILVGLLAVGTFALYFWGDSVSRKYSSSFLPIGNVYEEATYSDIKKLAASSEDFYVFFSKPTCKSCQESITPINKYAKKAGIKKIYLIDAGSDDGKTFAANYGIDRETTPQLLLINGKSIKFTSCARIETAPNGDVVCEFYDGSGWSKLGVVEAAKYIFSKN